MLFFLGDFLYIQRRAKADGQDVVHMLGFVMVNVYILICTAVSINIHLKCVNKR